jgi:hypothetical protein
MQKDNSYKKEKSQSSTRVSKRIMVKHSSTNLLIKITNHFLPKKIIVNRMKKYQIFKRK